MVYTLARTQIMKHFLFVSFLTVFNMNAEQFIK